MQCEPSCSVLLSWRLMEKQNITEMCSLYTVQLASFGGNYHEVLRPERGLGKVRMSD
jgi:hypothetical protein